MRKLTASLFLALFVLHTCPIHLLAQDNDEEDAFELSPFTLDAQYDQGFRAENTLAGSRLKTELKDVAGAINVIDANFFQDSGASILNLSDASEIHYANANGAVVRFAIAYYDELEKNRRPELVKILEPFKQLAESQPDLYYTPGALKIASGDRKKNRGKPKSHFTSYAHFSLSFSLHDGLSPQKRIASLRQLVAEVNIDSDTSKLYYGDALLLTTSPFSKPAYNAPISPFHRPAGVTSDLGASIPYLRDAKADLLKESKPDCSITLIKSADRVDVPFAFDTAAKSESIRLQSLNTALDAIEALVSEKPEISFIPGSLLHRHGDAQGELSKPQPSFTSQAQFTISFPVSPGMESNALVREIRELVRNADIPPSIEKVHYGSASIVLENPQRYRDEIITEIFQHLATLQSKLGEKFELIPEWKHERVQVRRHSDTEVEIWIPYDYRIESLAERKQREQTVMLEHERILASHEAAARRCRCCDETKK